MGARRGESPDPKDAAALRFAGRIVEAKGKITDSDFDEIRKAGFSDGEIAEVVATVSLNLFTNYFNDSMGTDIDFPLSPPLN